MKQVIKAFLFLLLFSYTTRTLAQRETKLTAKAARIHKAVFTVDSHTDTPMNFFDPGFNIAKNNSLTLRRSKVDFPRMKQGGLDGIIFAVFEGQGARTSEGNVRAKKNALATFDSIHTVLSRCPDMAGIALTPEEGYALAEKGKRAVFIGLENGYPVGNDLANVRLYYDLGARYITLCHTKNNDICTSSTDTNNTTGITAFGQQVVAEMNRLGMMIDVSHASDASFYDVLRITKKPVIASHSCSRAMDDNPRNLSDEMLKALAANDGVIQMCILSAYVKKSPPNPVRDTAFAELRRKWHNFQDLSETARDSARREYYSTDEKFPQALANVQDVCDHIDHIVSVAGIDHVGIGTDFDGGGGVSGCNDVSEMGNITLELVKRGYSKKQLQKIWGGNLMRVMKEVESTNN
jgi:membrane dipeptidase